MGNKEIELEVRQELIKLYDQLSNRRPGTDPISFYDDYRAVMKKHDLMTGQQFHIEAWKVEGECKREPELAFKHMIGDVEDMYNEYFKEYIPGHPLK